ncbi:hypothetical protein OJ996_05095 [Luteolibacter sp. GHJ8]|uniref:Transglutaminase superfamily protein n=1 Tax=Luteolibacter rhizosphaerae TaxID=2989719 RepID=A0ABT3FZC1_9BACT|nr:hypothetical protein [Luteolibacter rhizosphaerae]MCW1912937.1 hypothetical protein [Luteolibacter rhizosphaerae]
MAVNLGIAAISISSSLGAAQEQRPTILTRQFRGIAAIYASDVPSSSSSKARPAGRRDRDGQQPDRCAARRPHCHTATHALCTVWYLSAIMGFPWSTINSYALIAAADQGDEEVELKAGHREHYDADTKSWQAGPRESAWNDTTIILDRLAWEGRCMIRRTIGRCGNSIMISLDRSLLRCG